MVLGFLLILITLLYLVLNNLLRDAYYLKQLSKWRMQCEEVK